MKKSIFAILIALTLVLGVAAAANSASSIHELEYKGFGIIKAELKRGADWFNDSTVLLTDSEGKELDWVFLGGDEEEFYLRSADIADGASVTLQFNMNNDNQTISFDCVTGVKYRIDANGNAESREEKERCDFCNGKHDDDYCTKRIDAAKLPEDADSLARMFDIDRCDRCNGMGHDDDRCPNRKK